jgi:expansin (peptidoglycan-binding protein)
MARWPVTLSYFTQGKGEQTPVYVLSFDLYENGVSRALRLDYGDFALKGDMQSLELLPDKGCQR